MSKAFTKESDDAPEPTVRRRGTAVPELNYVTAAGAAVLRAELAAGASDARAHEISEHLATAIIMAPPADRSRVAFGAAVTVEDAGGARTRYRLVGALEASPRDGAIYFQSPVAEALFDAAVGDTVVLPRGEVEVVAIDYD